MGSVTERIAGFARWLVPVWLATAEEPARAEMRGLYWDRWRWRWIPPWTLELDRQDMLWNKWCADAKVDLQ